MHQHPLALAVACALALTPALAGADTGTAPVADAAQAAPRELDQVEVTANVYRDRTEAVTPTLSYDLEYFQRFEPLTVGDMLKRVPSVTFVSDVLEYDGARLRGLDPSYTQILINGRKVPGAGRRRHGPHKQSICSVHAAPLGCPAAPSTENQHL